MNMGGYGWGGNCVHFGINARSMMACNVEHVDLSGKNVIVIGASDPRRGLRRARELVIIFGEVH